MKTLRKRLLAAVLAASMIFAVSCKENDGNDSKPDADSTDSSVQTPSEDDSSEAPDSSEEDSSSDDSQQTPADTETSGITPAMWKIETDGGATIYFTGSMHALPDDAYPFPEEIMNAYNSSDAIAVECDVVAYESDFEAQVALAEQLMYTDGTSIKDHIGEDLYKKLVSMLKEWDMYLEAYDYFKPAFWQSLIENYYIESGDLKSDNGFDMYFLKKAKEDSKEIIEVESTQFQMDMLINFSDDIFKLMFQSYVETTPEEYIAELEELYNAWAAGDLDAILESDEVDEDQLTAEEIAAYEDYDKQMLTDRNKTMADKLIELSKGDKNVFFIVGAAHYVDDDGILALLDAAGVKYERIDYK